MLKRFDEVDNVTVQLDNVYRITFAVQILRELNRFPPFVYKERFDVFVLRDSDAVFQNVRHATQHAAVGAKKTQGATGNKLLRWYVQFPTFHFVKRFHVERNTFENIVG